jgi:L-idonate 5-dehydrogenase
MDLVMTKEITLKSSMRFAREFPVAVDLLASGRLELAPVLSHEFEATDAMEAFRTAGDRRRSMKVHLRF